MRVLLDTHALIWWWANDRALSGTAAELLSDGGSDIFVSAATGWEIATKHRLKKLDPGVSMDAFEELLAADGFIALPVEMGHALRAGRYRSPHADPFDRLLAGQAEMEELTLITRDPAFAGFPCRTLW